jgi:DNA-binding transcriptional LysR family regulator
VLQLDTNQFLIELIRLRYSVAIVDHGYLSPAALTRQLRQLEEELGASPPLRA